jgi:hypothetical protein
MSEHCRTTQQLFSDYFDGGLAPDERRLIEEHLRACPDCGTEYRHYTESLRALQATGAIETTRVFVQNVKAAAAAHLDRKENLLNAPSEAMTVITPKADSRVWPKAATPPTPAGPVAELHLPPWAPWALAAATFLAFVAGWAGGGRRGAGVDEERLAALVEERLRRAPATAPAVEPVDPRKILEAQGLVQHEGLWVPRRLLEDFGRGRVIVAGRAMSREEAAKLLAKELPPEAPAVPATPTTAAAPTEDEVIARFLEREKLARLPAGPLVPVEWARRWEEGWIQTGPDAWKKPAELKAELIREHQLVEFRGRLMSREQAESLQSLQTVKAPAGAAAANEFTRSLEGLEIGLPLGLKGLTVYPILAARPAPEAPHTTLHGALSSGRFEISDTLGLFQVQAKNGSDRDVLVLAGEILAGGRCARTVAEDTFVPAGQAAKLPVLCAEPSAWRAADRFARESGHHLAPPSLRRALAAEQGQGALWSLWSRRAGKSGAPADLYRKHAEALAEFRAFFGVLPEREASAIGVAVAIGEGLEFVELFPAHEALAAAFDRIVAGAATDLQERGADAPAKTAFPNSVKGVKQLLESAWFSTYEASESGLGVRRDDASVGRVCLAGDGTPAHALLFAAAAAPEADRKGGAAVPREKARRALDDFEVRLKAAGPARRASIVRELGALGVADAVPVLVKHLTEPDVPVRRAVIQELAATEDPRVSEPLLQVLARNRTEPAVFAEAARALARLGEDRAVEPLLRALDPAEPDTAKAVLQALPELLPQSRSLAVSMPRLIGLFESWEGAAAKPDVLADPVAKAARPAELQALVEALRGALKQIVGIEFTTAAGARKWWNDRDARERFLKDKGERR